MLLVSARIADGKYFIVSHCVQKRALVHAHKQLAVLKNLLFHSFRVGIRISKAR